MHLSERLRVSDDGWRLVETGWDADRAPHVGTNFLCGNGYLGYRGTSPEHTADDLVALVVTDTYDTVGDGWQELVTAPNPLLVAATVDGSPIGVATAERVETSLDLRIGEFGARFAQRVDHALVEVDVRRVASYDDLHLLTQRWQLQADADVEVDLVDGVDGVVWSLHGDHFRTVDLDDRDGTIVAEARTVEHDVRVVVAAASTRHGGESTEVDPVVEPRRRFRRHRVRLPAGTPLVVDTVAAVVTSNDVDDPGDVAPALARRGRAEGHEQLLSSTTDAWRRIWDDLDVVVEGHLADQTTLRFSAYHHRICTPAHTDHLPIGARGLSCQGYQNAAFWDQEVYNLPALWLSEPHLARNLLVYRHRTLDGARRKAERLGYRGAYYAWMSTDTGDDVCPDVFFVDVLSGRPIRNHFNDWQMHISPDLATTVARYVEITGDERFLVDHGAEIAFEVARFLHSFVLYDEVRGTYHCIRLLGPDEWHENVDDNAFTNHQAHDALAFAVDTHERLAADHPVALEQLRDRIGLTDDEVAAWARVRDRIALPEPDPDTGLIEQFRGFFELEDVTPEQVRARLLDPGEYWGWPNGVAVPTQVSKQADVVMLLWLHGDRFESKILDANYHYYAPRCAHFSTLSHPAHGMVAVRIGELDRALAHLRTTATVDLLSTAPSVVGGTFIGGIHTAACSGALQVAVQGFGGLGFADGRLVVDPALPSAWTALEYPVAWRGHHLRVRIGSDGSVSIESHADNPGPVEVVVRGEPVTVEPGARAAA
jgi:kojibiose phosphorylase